MKSKGKVGRMTRLVWQAGCGMLSHKGTLFCTTGGQGEFYPIILQVLEALHFNP